MPKLLNQRKGGDVIPPDAVHIDRRGPYGNPFVVGRHGTREEVVRRFECEAMPLMNLEPLRGKDLVCWCSPLLCHGEPIMRKLYGDDWRSTDT